MVTTLSIRSNTYIGSHTQTYTHKLIQKDTN